MWAIFDDFILNGISHLRNREFSCIWSRKFSCSCRVFLNFLQWILNPRLTPYIQLCRTSFSIQWREWSYKGTSQLVELLGVAWLRLAWPWV